MYVEEEATGNMILVNIPEEQYPDNIAELLKDIVRSHRKICYVCLTKTYTDAIEYIENLGLDVDKFYFIDILTSHYKKPEPVDNCTFVESPTDMEEIISAIKQSIIEKGCEEIFIDTISSLFVYHEGYIILKFTNELRSGETAKIRNLKESVLVAVTGDKMLAEFYDKLSGDLLMFADKIVVLDKKKKK